MRDGERHRNGIPAGRHERRKEEDPAPFFRSRAFVFFALTQADYFIRLRSTVCRMPPFL